MPISLKVSHNLVVDVDLQMDKSVWFYILFLSLTALTFAVVTDIQVLFVRGA